MTLARSGSTARHTRPPPLHPKPDTAPVQTRGIDASGWPIERDVGQQLLHLPRAQIGNSYHNRHRTQHQIRFRQPLPGIYRRSKRHLGKCHHPAKPLASGNSRTDRFSVAGDATNASIAARNALAPPR